MADNIDELQCSLVLKENITNDVYIFVEEIEALPDFEFWSHFPIETEKPSMVSQNYELIYRLSLSTQIYNGQLFKTSLNNIKSNNEKGPHIDD